MGIETLNIETPNAEKEQKEKRKNGLITAFKALGFVALLSMPMKAKAEENFQLPSIDAEKITLELKKINPEDLEAGVKDVGGIIAKEMEAQGYSENDIKEVVTASAQEDSQLMPEQKVKM